MSLSALVSPRIHTLIFCSDSNVSADTMEAVLGALASRFNILVDKLPCDCDACKYQYQQQGTNPWLDDTYSGNLTKDEVIKLANSYTRSINDHREFISKMIRLHGNIILKRWRRDRKGREKFLRTASPGIHSNRTQVSDVMVQTQNVNIMVRMNVNVKSKDEILRRTALLPYKISTL